MEVARIGTAYSVAPEGFTEKTRRKVRCKCTDLYPSLVDLHKTYGFFGTPKHGGTCPKCNTYYWFKY
jgi:hypothetical protein